jgi:DNA ligase (NAD+)
VKGKMKELLDAASKAYYEGKPFMSDAEFDILCAECNYEPVGYSGDFEIAHLFPMYSLQKVFVGEQHPPYDHSTGATIVSPKLDGAAVSLGYWNGDLIIALTRGDGKRGRNITEKMRQLVPEKIDRMGAVQITGEVVAPETIPNARNYASGALNLKSMDEFNERPAQCENWTEDLSNLASANFDTVLQSSWAGYPQDGVVFRVNNRAKYEEMGYTSHHPRGAFALKERPPGVITRLLDVVWQVGKSGVVSPVAILEPVLIGEATVSRATLHNMKYITELGLEIGCSVEVIRSGEIIPRVVRRVEGEACV